MSRTRPPTAEQLAAELGLDADAAGRVLAWLGRSGAGLDLPTTHATGPVDSNGDTAGQDTDKRDTDKRDTDKRDTDKHDKRDTPGADSADVQTRELATPERPPSNRHDGLDDLGAGVTFAFGLDDHSDAPGHPHTRTLDAAHRYEDRGLLGRGGMGEVRRVFDRRLERTVAMKVLSATPTGSTSRFVEEARLTARLQHPGILPVHDIGRLPDGRIYFTMQEIRGRTLRDHVKEVHAASKGDRWQTAVGGWSFRRLVAAFQDICEAVAYAHGENLVHRDLKPRNVMVGAHGEVLVVDWGLARPTGTPLADGTLVGTPSYLAPELLREPPPAVHPRTDVYALGGILYNILTNRAPFDAEEPSTILEMVRAGPSPSMDSRLPLPDELVELCVLAMAREPGSRVGHAGVLAAAVRTWLDGSRKRSQALEMVRTARDILPEALALRDQADALEARYGASLAEVPVAAAEELKHAAWEGLDRARSLRARARTRESEAEVVLQGALTVDPSLAEAHAELAARSMERHAEAERSGDEAEATAALVRLRRHFDALPAHHGSRTRLRAYLRGTGSLSLRTSPPGARVTAHRVIDRHRRLVLDFGEELGATPLDGVSLGHGSWVLRVEHDGFEPVSYPVRIGRGEHWRDGRNGDHHDFSIPLVPSGRLGPNECLVPAGWTTVGGDPVAPGSALRRSLWIDGFVMERHPVTNRRFLAFLDDLVAQGREAEALRYAPRERGGSFGVQGAPIYGRDDQGRFVLRVDVHGDRWLPDQPVLMVDWFGAMAFAAWESLRSGLPWRLPSEWEWEKAARGVDERPYPWGPFFDPSRACTRLSHEGRPQPARVSEYPVDESPYGVRGLAGNVRDWCLDQFQEVPPPEGSTLRLPDTVDPDHPRVNRGGFWLGNQRDARSADRHFHLPTHRSAEIGFRLVRSWPGAS